MGYNTWTVGGVVLRHVREMENNQKDGVITLNCSALNWNLVGAETDPRDEIALVEALQSQYISNEPLFNGGSKLQVGNGQIISVTDGTDTWTKCALESITIKEDHKSTKRIDYDLIIHYELAGSGGSYVYTPNYDDYTNISYYMWTNKDPNTNPHDAYGNEIGWMQITETMNVKRVEVYGSACVNPTSNYLDVNGQREYWTYTHDNGSPWTSCTLNQGWEKLTFDLDTPTTTIVLQSPDHNLPNDTCATNLGCWLQWVKVYYE